MWSLFMCREMDFKETVSDPISTVNQAARAGDISRLKQLIDAGELFCPTKTKKDKMSKLDN